LTIRSGKIAETHSVGSAGDLDFSVFTIAEIAMKHTATVTPIHFVARPQSSVDFQGRHRCTATAPLTCLPGLAGWQSLSTGHVYLK
jgi:hypothetical protein